MQLVDGAWVTLRGEVRRVLGPHSFALGSGGGDGDTLVYGAQTSRLDEGDTVEATGRIEAFQGAEVEPGPPLDRDDAIHFDYVVGHALFAEHVRVTQEG